MLTYRLNISPKLLFQEIDGGGVVRDLASAAYFGLDEIGVRFWQLLQDDPSVQAATLTPLAEFNVAPGEMEHDLDSLLKQLVNARSFTH